MKIKKYLKLVANIEKSDIKDDDASIYVSKFDGSYLTRVGMESSIKHLADREITEELTHGVGFSKKDKKWYGWSHRSIYGFKKGSTCKKGDAHYIGSTNDALEQAAIDFWADEHHKNVRCAGVVNQGGEKYFDIKWLYDDAVQNEKLRNKAGGCLHHIKPTGRGEWQATTLAEAKQMAQDFSEGVS